MTTKASLATQIADELDDSSNTALLALIKEWLDEIISDICLRFKWPLLNTTVTATLDSASSTVNIDGVLDILSIQRTDNNEVIPKINAALIAEVGNDFSTSGPPIGWFIDSFDQVTQAWVIKFNQIADQNYSLLLFCKKEVKALLDTEHIPFPINVDYIIKNGIRQHFFLHEDAVQTAMLYESKYERGIANFLSNYGDLSATMIQARQNSDLAFASAGKSYDVNLDKDRLIIES